MRRKKLLLQVNSSFDLNLCTALVRDHRNQFEVDLLIPELLLRSTSSAILQSYSEVISFNSKIRNLFSCAAIVGALDIARWAKSRRDYYHAILFGAYRNDITSLLARHFHGRAGLFAVKQGIDLPNVYYKTYGSLRGLHNYFYYRLFGFSDFRHERLIQYVSSPKKSDYFFMRPMWREDPFNRGMNVFTIGIQQNGFDDGTPFLIPDFKLLQNQTINYSARQGILVVGERTPMTPSWGKKQDELLREIYSVLLHAVAGERIYLRGRKNLTNNAFYSQLDPIFLDPDQLYDDQLLKLNPRLVVSVKSTATKVAAYYGYATLLFYPCMNFEPAERKHLDYLFADGAPIERVTAIDEIPTLISKDHIQRSVDREFSQRTLDLFFERLNRGNVCIS